MRKFTFTFLIIIFHFIFSTNAQTINNPSYRNSDAPSLQIDRIVLKNNSTEVYFTHTAPKEYKNGGWVRIDPNIFIAETYGSRKFKLQGAEGIPLAPEKFDYSYGGQTLNFRLIFPKLPDDIEEIDMIECPDSKDCFNFYGIKIIKKSSRNNNVVNDRSNLRETIQDWGRCRNIAINSSGYLAIAGKKGYIFNGIPEAMGQRIKELSDSDYLIDEIVLTENNRWLIIWGNNGYQYNDIPSELINVLKSWNESGEVIYSVTFNDNGEWIAISKNKYVASNNNLTNFLKEGSEKHGKLWSAHMTDDGLVVSYESGYQFLGEVPENLKNKLSSSRINVDKIKFLKDGTYFFADTKENYSYNL